MRAIVAASLDKGLDHECIASLDDITTIPVELLGKDIGFLLERQELDLARAIAAAFDLD